MNITQRLSPNRTIGRQRQTPDIIVLHTTGGTFTSAINTILNPASQASYHFVISGSGDIVQAVDIENMAWANGTTNSGDNRDNRHSTLEAVRTRRVNANLYTVSIAFGDMPTGIPSEAQMNAVVWLIRHIRAEIQRIYGFTMPIPFTRLNIVGHNQITPITRPDCPGRHFPWDELMRRLNSASNSSNSDNHQTQNINVPNVTWGTTRYIVDGKPFPRQGLLHNGELFLPAAEIFRAMGATAVWDRNTDTTTVTTNARR